MRNAALRAALTAVARAFPAHYCKAERSSPGMTRIVLHRRADGRHQLGWTAADWELTDTAAQGLMIEHMRATLNQQPNQQ